MVHLLNRFAGWVIRHKERIKMMGTGMFLYACYNYVFDYPVYIFLTSYWGIIVGGLIAFAISLVQNVGMFWAYDRMKIDWLGAYALRELETKENKNKFERLAVWVGKSDKTWWERVLTFVAFVLLLVRIDPLIVAVHFRQQHFNGLKMKEWVMLVAAVVIGNAWWLAQIGILVEVFKFLWAQAVS